MCVCACVRACVCDALWTSTAVLSRSSERDRVQRADSSAWDANINSAFSRHPERVKVSYMFTRYVHLCFIVSQCEGRKCLWGSRWNMSSWSSLCWVIVSGGISLRVKRVYYLNECRWVSFLQNSFFIFRKKHRTESKQSESTLIETKQVQMNQNKFLIYFINSSCHILRVKCIFKSTNTYSLSENIIYTRCLVLDTGKLCHLCLVQKLFFLFNV